MNFKQVGGPPFRFVCIECKQVFDHGMDTIAYADLEGRPWRDYYCNQCAHTIYQREMSKSPLEAAGSQS